jgi:hypothetical protein
MVFDLSEAIMPVWVFRGYNPLRLNIKDICSASALTGISVPDHPPDAESRSGVLGTLEVIVLHSLSIIQLNCPDND